MTKGKAPTTKRGKRTCRLEAKVSQRIYDAVHDHAAEKSLTLSTALSCILIDWEKSERRRKARIKKIESEAQHKFEVK